MAIGNIEGLAHIGIYVKNMEASKKFYCGVLGFEIVFERSEPYRDNKKVQISF